MHCAFGGGIRGMGERVTQSHGADLARAARLKQALENGDLPSFVNAGAAAAPAPAMGSYSDTSCAVPSSLQSHGSSETRDTRLQFFEQMFEALPDGLIIADSNHRGLWANQTFATMFGYTVAEILGQPLENLVVPSNRLAESKWVSESLAKGERITLETKRCRKDGTLVDVSVCCAPLLLDG